MYHWAYHINDDRYDHILSIPDEEVSREKSLIKWRSKVEDLDEEKNAASDAASEVERNDSGAQSLAEPVLHTSTRSSVAATRHIEVADSFSSILSHTNEFATVELNDVGNVVVSCNAEYRDYWVNIGAVANKGTYTVPDFTPVSKAYKLCEYLHCIVCFLQS